MTGAGRGIGEAIARRLHLAGHIVVVRDIAAAGAQAVTKDLGERAIVVELAVTSERQWRSVVRAAVKDHV